MENENIISVKDIKAKEIFERVKEDGVYDATYGPIPDDMSTQIISILAEASGIGIDTEFSSIKIDGKSYIKAHYEKSKILKDGKKGSK